MNKHHEKGVKYQRFMAGYYESKESKSLDESLWMPTMNMELPDPKEDPERSLELLSTTSGAVMDDFDSTEEKVQLLNWTAYVRDQGRIS